MKKVIISMYDEVDGLLNGSTEVSSEELGFIYKYSKIPLTTKWLWWTRRKIYKTNWNFRKNSRINKRVRGYLNEKFLWSIL